ncbi:TPA: fimbria/pilus outer membrane usher protein, partial [Escherichia coli]
QLYTSGDVTMKITGEDGREQIRVFPLSVINGQLNPGQHEFNIAAGLPDNDSQLKGGVFAASYGYGLDNLTLRTGGVFSNGWAGGSAGVVVGLSYLGAVSVDGAYNIAKYRDGSSSGNKVQVSWSKQLEVTNSGLRVSWSRQNKEYGDISSFSPSKYWGEKNHGRQTKDEWNLGISQPVNGLFNLSVTAWQRTYYSISGVERYLYRNGKDMGVTGMLSTQIKGVSLNLGGAGSRSFLGKNDWLVSASVSVPFTLFERRYNSSSS